MYLPIPRLQIQSSFTPYVSPVPPILYIGKLGKFYLYWHFLRKLILEGRSISLLEDCLEVSAGINHIRSNIHGLVAEAYYLRRIPILAPINLPDFHNLDCHVEEKCFSDYFNLSESFLKIGDEKMTLEYALPEDVVIEQNRIQSIKLVDGHEVIPDDINRHCDLIIREKYSSHRMLPGSYKDSEVAKIYYKSSLYLQPRRDLLEAAEIITRQLGEFFFLFCRMPWDSCKINFKKNIHDYMIYHDATKYAIFEHFMTGEGLSRQLMKIFPKGGKLYIASNLWPPRDKDLFDPLKKYYDVYRYYDFLELEHFADLTKKVGNNTAKLQLIEETIQKKSNRIFGVHYWGLWSYDNSLKNLIAMPDSPDWIED